MARRIRTIAIIGGGFSGTVLAADLLRTPGSTPTRLVLIERRHEVGRGVAYQKSDFPYVLNVPASRMSVNPDDAQEFVRFAAGTHPELAGQAFLPREVYGEYLQDVLARAERSAPAHVELRRVHAQAEEIVQSQRSGKFVVRLSDREQLLADEVVLACGDPPPSGCSALQAIDTHPGYTLDPYAQRIPFESLRRVLIVGSGLTMCDIAVAAASFNPAIQIHAVSRHGLLPAAQSTAAVTVADADIRESLERAPATARAVLRAFRHVLRQVLSRGGDWRDAIGLARAAAPRIWNDMTRAERARFLRHVRPYWDVHRHRVPASTAYRLSQLRHEQRLTLHAGRIIAAEPDDGADGKLRVRFLARGTGECRELLVDAIINCSGAYGRVGAIRDSMLQGLIASGLAVPDAHGLGLQVNADGALIGADGGATAGLYYVGPMLRAKHWEATAAGELRAFIATLTKKLLEPQSSDSRDLGWEALCDIAGPGSAVNRR